jgi:hypothetical protein
MTHKRQVYVSRTMLVMLVVAAVVVIGLGIAAAVLVDPPETDGWLRYAFGQVFSTAALILGAVIGVPSAVGLWAMSGANAEGAVPALPRPARLVLGAVAIVTVVATAVILLVTGSAVGVLNFGLLALVALAVLGLGGAVSFSTHRWRAILSAVALVLVVAGTAWILRFFVQTNV